MIGHTTDTLRFVVKHGGVVEADLPIKDLGDEAPLYDRPHVATPQAPVIDAADCRPPCRTRRAAAPAGYARPAPSAGSGSNTTISSAATRVARPGGDAAVVRVGDGPKGLALTTDVTQRYCEADPVEGGKQAVAEAWRNLTAAGRIPRALTDNLNFGNPEKPEIMGQLVGCIAGIGEACRALDFPIVSGNVSLYNESAGRGILPTPAIGGVGVIADVALGMTLGLQAAGRGVLSSATPPAGSASRSTCATSAAAKTARRRPSTLRPERAERRLRARPDPRRAP